MKKSLKLVQIDSEYCDYLREFDERVPYNFGKKSTRPFVGVLFMVENQMYFAPVSSPKEKHLMMKDSIDFFKLDNGILGAINFNNMIPVKTGYYKEIDFEQIIDNKYKILLKKQYYWLNRHTNKICSFSKRLYKLYLSGNLDKKIFDRCCNFKMLEEKCEEYNKQFILN